MTWNYYFDGEVVASVRRPVDEPPYLGMPVTIVGRLKKLAPAEQYVVSGYGLAEHVIVLEKAP